MIGKLIDAAVKAPGQLAEAAAETVTRLPEIPLRIADGLVKGAERGIGKATEGDSK